MFAHLRTDRSRDQHPEITYHRAPHKPFLLLSVMDLIAQGWITENLINLLLNLWISPKSSFPKEYKSSRT
jgi:putative restriction endonuclease